MLFSFMEKKIDFVWSFPISKRGTSWPSNSDCRECKSAEEHFMNGLKSFQNGGNIYFYWKLMPGCALELYHVHFRSKRNRMRFLSSPISYKGPFIAALHNRKVDNTGIMIYMRWVLIFCDFGSLKNNLRFYTFIIDVCCVFANE